MKTLSVKIPDSLALQIEQVARKRHEKKSQVVREALEQLVADQQNSSEVSCFSLAADLAGTVQGAEDLSTDPKHMKGYGE